MNSWNSYNSNISDAFLYFDNVLVYLTSIHQPFYCNNNIIYYDNLVL